jgi:hypothetical protein
MRVAAAALLVAVPLAAQSPRDTADIRAAAADSGERAVVERIVGDTAWAFVFDPRKTIDIPGGNGRTAGTAIAMKKVRLERRSGRWVTVKPKP